MSILLQQKKLAMQHCSLSNIYEMDIHFGSICIQYSNSHFCFLLKLDHWMFHYIHAKWHLIMSVIGCCQIGRIFLQHNIFHKTILHAQPFLWLTWGRLVQSKSWFKYFLGEQLCFLVMQIHLYSPSYRDVIFLIVFIRCPGFIKLKIQSTYGSPVAFVDFQVLSSCCGVVPSIIKITLLKITL